MAGIVVLGLTQTGGQKKAPDRLSLAADAARAPGRAAAAGRGLSPGQHRRRRLDEGLPDARSPRCAGHPVVVNKWASWCGPCRTEFPIFQHAATKYGKQVAFLGVNANDHDAAARRFLKSEALPYPSFSDGNLAISGKLGIVSDLPHDGVPRPQGKRQYIHQGYYTSTAALAADIRRYALGAPS